MKFNITDNGGRPLTLPNKANQRWRNINITGGMIAYLEDVPFSKIKTFNKWSAIRYRTFCKQWGYVPYNQFRYIVAKVWDTRALAAKLLMVKRLNVATSEILRRL